MRSAYVRVRIRAWTVLLPAHFVTERSFPCRAMILGMTLGVDLLLRVLWITLLAFSCFTNDNRDLSTANALPTVATVSVLGFPLFGVNIRP